MVASLLELFLDWFDWRRYRFPTREMEEQFQAQTASKNARLAILWGSLNGVGTTLVPLLSMERYGWYAHPDWGALSLFAAAMTSVVFVLAALFVPMPRRVVGTLLYATTLFMIGWAGWLVHLVVGEELRIAQTGSLVDVWPVLAGNAVATHQLEAFIMAEEARKFFRYMLWYLALILALMQATGLNRGLMLMPLSLVAMPFITSQLSPRLQAPMYDLFIAYIITAFCLLLSGLYVLRLHRQQFATDYLLQQTLTKETEAMQSLARQEKQQRETSQEADSILNHILKNTMADALGCIYLYLRSATAAQSPDLAQAVGCLERGMVWCRKRQALLRITAGNYALAFENINLRPLAEIVVKGRTVAVSTPDAAVVADSLLLHIVLDNALANAFRHGDPVSPEVHLSLRLSDVEDMERKLLTIRITNRADPARPPLPPTLIADVLAGRLAIRRPSCVSEGLGLPHLIMAAAAHGMQFTLQQEDDVVVMDASVEVSLPPSGHRAASPGGGRPRSLISRALPAGLHVLCLDDSPMACRLLQHMFTTHLRNATVRTFGATSAEVQTFMTAARAGADIIVMDNNLDYDDVHYVGVDLVADLVQDEFGGLICMRTGSTEPADEEKYRAAGAHCILGKDLNPTQTMTRLATAFDAFRCPLVQSCSSLFSQVDADEFHCVSPPASHLPGQTLPPGSSVR